MGNAGLTISAKDLGAFAVAGACERCLWVSLHVPRLPYQMFPGIFSSIDLYNKQVVHAYFDRAGFMPSWLASVGDVTGYVEPPSYRRFSVLDPASGVTLRGTADGIFRLRDGGYAIIDYKTARYTPNQESMLPIYQTQLNGYAFIGDRVGFAPVRALALVYMEPITDLAAASDPSVVGSSGFALNLSATIVPVDLRPDDTVLPLLQRVRVMCDTVDPPPGRTSCRDCQATEDLWARLGHGAPRDRQARFVLPD